MSDLAPDVIAGRYRALGRAISLAEREAPEAERLLAEIYPATGRARLVGVAGAPRPGSARSPLGGARAKHYRRQKKRVGIVAVDPTSPFSGGAILGDRIRMAEL